MSRKRKAAVCCLVAISVLLDEEIQKKKLRKRWSREWFFKRGVLSNDCNLLNELHIGDEVNDYRNYLRMDRSTFQLLLSKITPIVKKRSTRVREPISPEERLTATLRFLATGRCFEDLKFSMRISPQALGQIIIETCKTIRKVLKNYIQLPNTEKEWKQIAYDFKMRWQYPKCLGAIDGKHVQIRKPAKSGSRYFNYKGTFSVVLMAVVDANYEVIFADVGTNGRISDGGVIKNTTFYELLNNNKMNIPAPSKLPKSNKVVPYVFVGDEAFALQVNFMKPYSLAALNDERRIYNYRHSRARRVVENFFGILNSRFMVFKKPINLSPDKVKTVVLACCYLHNSLNRHSRDYHQEQSGTQTLLNSAASNRNLTPLNRTSAGAKASAKQVRGTYCSYFNNERIVEWQSTILEESD